MDDALLMCPICASRRVKIQKRIKSYVIWRCVDCRLYWVPGVTDAELECFYNAQYFKGGQEYGYSDYLSGELIHRRNAQMILRMIASHSPKIGRLLDVGCAYGFLIDEACRAGWNAEGVECSDVAYTYARAELKCKVNRGTLLDTKYPDNYFDAITVIGSIEHMRDPITFVEEAARILKNDALLVITTIDVGEYIQVFRFKPPEHLYYFSRRNLSKLLTSRGFTVERKQSLVAHFSIREVVGLLLHLIFNPKIETESIIRWVPGRQRSLKLPNNEMLIVARKTSAYQAGM